MDRVDRRRSHNHRDRSFYHTHARQIIDNIEYELHTGSVIKYADEIIVRRLHLTRGASMTCYLIDRSQAGGMALWPKYFCYARSARGVLIGYAYLVSVTGQRPAMITQFGVFVQPRYRRRGIATHLISLLAALPIDDDLTIIVDRDIAAKVAMYFPGRILADPKPKYLIASR